MALSVTGIGQDLYPTTVEDYRNLIGAAVPGNGAIGAGAQFPVSPVQQEAGLAVQVGAGRAVLEGRAADGQGSYFVWSAEPEVIVWPAPAAQPRIDTLAVAVADGQYGQVETQGPSWLIVQGVASTTPVAPANEEIDAAAPAGAWARVADIRTDPGDTVIAPAHITHALTPADGGWKPMILPSNIATYLGRTPSYRVRDGRVWLKGAVTPGTGGDFSDNATFGGRSVLQAPAEIAPASISYGTLQSVARRSANNYVGGGLMRGEVQSDGLMYAYRDNWDYTTSWIGFDNFYWWLD